jgi:adenylate cyclase
MSDANYLAANPLSFLLQLAPTMARFLVLIAALLLCAGLYLVSGASLVNLEERLGAKGWTLSPQMAREERIIVVAIDEASLAEVGPWPWTRDQLATLVDAIDGAGAQLQLHDIAYPEARPGDDALLASLQNARGAVIAQIPAIRPGQSVATGQMTHPISGINCDSSGGGIQLPTAGGYLAPHSGFASIAKGHITTVISNDGAVRKFPAIICSDGQAYPALALTAFLQASNFSPWQASIVPGSTLLAPAYILKLDAYPGLDIPLDADGNLRISFAKDPSATYTALSAVDVINGSIDERLLDNAWVLVGGTAFGMGDIIPTPYNGATAGVELHARMLGSLLDIAVPYTPRSAPILLGLLCLLFSLALYRLANGGDRIKAYGLPVAAVVLPVAALTLHLLLLQSTNIWLGWLFPALYGACAASFLLLLELSRVRSERSRVFINLNSYLPDNIAKEIAYSLPSSSINAQRCDVTVLSADLRNFSAFSETRPPEEPAAVLHYFFTRAAEIIERHGGRVHEFKGDSLLAVWDGYDQKSAAAALAAGQDMQAAVYRNLLPEHALEGLEPMALGIGIEQGPVLIGSIGPAHRRTHALLGETVSIALRIQEMTAELAQPILIGECAARQLRDEALQSQGSYLLSGLKTPHVLFAPFLDDSQDSGDSSAQPNLRLLSGGRH